MRRLFKTTFVCVVSVITVILLVSTPLLEKILSFVFNETKSSENVFEDAWYFNQLSEIEQEIYLKIATAVSNFDSKVVDVGDKLLSSSHAASAFEAYLLDNPGVFYISGAYQITESNFLNVGKIKIKIEYSGNKASIEKNIKLLDQKVERIVAQTTDVSMTDYEKQLALHDYLVENIRYYDFTNMDEIPSEKHNAYAALVDNEAVCDGISKAYKLLLNKCNINSVVVTGKMGNKHAWNKVKVEDSWYNVDVTSDACGKDRVLTHTYFNLSDDEITVTHKFDSMFDTPECTGEKYDYYTYNDFELTNQDFFGDKIKSIVEKSKGKNLEIRVTGNFDIKDIVQKLYDINFNNYKVNNVREINYYHVQDVIIVPRIKK